MPSAATTEEAVPVPRARRDRARSAGRRLALLVGVLLFATACAEQELPLNTLDPRGPAARDIDWLMNTVLIIAGFIFLGVNVGLIYIAVKFRQRKADDGTFPAQVHGDRRLEWAWTAVPMLIMAVVAVLSTNTLFKTYYANAQPDDIVVRVEGQQWWWSFQYDTDGDGVYDLSTATEMVIPVGQKIVLDITSYDVIHSFWIPKLHGKRDAVPGRNHEWWLQADEPGYYLGQCTEFCGLSHAYMRMAVVAVSEDEYRQWLADQKRIANEPVTASELRGREIFAQQCTTCHQVRGVNGRDCVPLEDGEAFTDPETQCYPGIGEGWARAAQVSGNAPDLTHLMSRQRFIGGIEDLYLADGETPNRNTMKAWIRNPEAFKAMEAEPNEYSQFGRGMPALPLTEAQLDDVVDYLITLK
jgi:cytochrome c oxidase subunit II